MSRPRGPEPAWVAEARGLIEAGLGWVAISKQLGVSESRLKWYLVEAPRRRGEPPCIVKGKTACFRRSVRHPRASERMQEPLRFEHDPRDLTGRICGDPMPGRSALDRRMRA